MNINEELIHRIIISEINQNVRFNPTKVHVYNIFNEINGSCFRNRLPLCNIQMLSNKKYLGYFSYDGINGNKLNNPTIYINPNYQYTIKELESVVAHEMIHYYLAYFGIDVNCKHGNEFHSLASQINSRMGLQINDTVDISNMGYSKQQMRISAQLLAYMNSYANSLKQYLPRINQESKNKNGRLATFYSELYSFTSYLVSALNRAVKKRSLNEGFWQKALSMGGDALSTVANDITNGMTQKVLPFKPINYMVNGFRKGYNNGQRWFQRNNGTNTQRNGGNGLQRDNSLTSLLYFVYPKIKRQYQNFSMGYSSQLVTNEFTIIDDLKTRIDAEINNAQGNKP